MGESAININVYRGERKEKRKKKKKSLERESIFYGKNRGEPERFTFRSVRSLLVYAFLTLAA